MKIFLLRHGQANYSLEKETGEFPSVPLTKEGKLQAIKLIPKLLNLNPTKIICSDLTRAKQTIEPSLKKLKVIIEYDSRIREIDDYLTGYSNSNNSIESVESQKNRINSFITDLKNRNDECLIIVAHFNIIEYISNAFGQKIKSPELASIYELII